MTDDDYLYFVPVKLTLPKHLFDALQDRCDEEDIPLAQGIRHAIKDWVNSSTPRTTHFGHYSHFSSGIETVKVRDGIL